MSGLNPLTRPNRCRGSRRGYSPAGPGPRRPNRQVVELLLKRLRRLQLDSRRMDGRFLLEADGTISLPDGQLPNPAVSTRLEVARFIRLGYVPT